jgi:hypothetical protein
MFRCHLAYGYLQLALKLDAGFSDSERWKPRSFQGHESRQVVAGILEVQREVVLTIPVQCTSFPPMWRVAPKPRSTRARRVAIGRWAAYVFRRSVWRRCPCLGYERAGPPVRVVSRSVGIASRLMLLDRADPQ